MSKERWASKLGLIFAVAGSAVGLGNFLRFPGQAAANGGGAFMIPYFVSFLLLGIPICWAEWIIGKKGGSFGFNSIPAIFGAIGGSIFWRIVGLIGVLIPIIIYMYYVVIESWCLAYALSYLTGAIDLGSDNAAYAANSKQFFSLVTGSAQNGIDLSPSVSSGTFLWVFVFAINVFLIFKGLSGGIEKFCKFAIPLMALCAVIVLVRVLTLGTPVPENPERNVINGLGYMWNPGGLSNKPLSEILFNPDVWLAAAGQVFFSLSVGFGIIINYSSYLEDDEDVVLSALSASSTNEFFEVCLGGMITIPAAFIFLGAAGTSGGTFSIGFETLPVVFEYMQGGHFFGFLWFFMLFLAAITSSISMLQPALAFLKEHLNMSKTAILSSLVALTAAGSLFIQYFSHGLTALDTMDFWVGTALIFVLACVQVALFIFKYGVDVAIEDANSNAHIKLPKVFKFVITYVTPTFLILISIGWALNNAPGYFKTLLNGGVPLYSVLVIIGVFLILSVIALREKEVS